MHGKLTVRKLVLYGLMTATLVGLQVAMASLPNIEAVSLLIMVFTVVFGGGVAYIIAAFVVLEMIIWGINTWVISYLYVWGILAAAAWLLRGMKSPVGWALLSGSFGLAFGALCALVSLPIGGFPLFITTWITGIPFDFLHCAGNFVIALVLFRPCRELLEKLYAGALKST